VPREPAIRALAPLVAIGAIEACARDLGIHDAVDGTGGVPAASAGLAWGDFLTDAWTLTSRCGVVDVPASVEGNGHGERC
jgi:hypothetical protein